MRFKKYWLVVLDGENQVDKAVKIAANYHLQCLYKIGVYGKERQHELQLVGKIYNYLRFLREWKSVTDK